MHAKSVLLEVIIPGDVSTIFQSIQTASLAGFNPYCSSATIAIGGGALMVNYVLMQEQWVAKLTYTQRPTI